MLLTDTFHIVSIKNFREPLLILKKFFVISFMLLVMLDF